MRRLDHFEKAAFDALIGAGFDRNEAMTFIQDRADKRFTAAVAAMPAIIEAFKDVNASGKMVQWDMVLAARAAVLQADALLAALAEGETK